MPAAPDRPRSGGFNRIVYAVILLADRILLMRDGGETDSGYQSGSTAEVVVTRAAAH